MDDTGDTQRLDVTWEEKYYYPKWEYLNNDSDSAVFVPLITDLRAAIAQGESAAKAFVYQRDKAGKNLLHYLGDADPYDNEGDDV